MTQIICPQTFVPVRKDPSHKSEQVSQLLFGETATVNEVNRDWALITCHYDNYEGWVEKKVILRFSTEKPEANVIKGFSRLVKLDGNSLWLSTGSELSKLIIEPQSGTVITFNPEMDSTSVSEIAMQYIGTPYLWGGRSFMGIDCSGFTQVVFKALGIKLLRDASQQVAQGDVISFIADTKAGDLAFFDNDDGVITHVGIILEPGKIIHASGSVRIDKLDQQGIYNTDLNTYTHNLRIIKRIM